MSDVMVREGMRSKGWDCVVTPDEISPGELGRKVDDLKTDIKEDMAEIKSKFNDVIYRDTFDAELNRLRDRQIGLERSMAFTRGLMVTLFVALLGLLGTLLAIFARSGG